MKKNLIRLSLFLMLTMLSYTFDISIEGLADTTQEGSEETTMAAEKSKILFSGELNNTITVNSYNTDRYLYLSKKKLELVDEQTVQNSINLDFNLEYEVEDYKFKIKTYTQYINNTNVESILNEAVVQYTPNYNWSIAVGKIPVNWGKGYAFNAVGILNPIKDPDNPEAEGEGKKLISLDYNKSFSNFPVTNYTGSLLVSFDKASLNQGKTTSAKDIEAAFKNYVLMFDTDIEFLTGYRQERLSDIGVDFSRNILPELELHGEYNYKYGNKITLKNNLLQSEETNSFQSVYLVGLKYVLPTNTGVTLEYYHNDFGRDVREYEYFSEYSKQALEKDIIKNYSIYFNQKNNFKDYGYLKLSHSDPLGIVYLNVYAASMINLQDKSTNNSIGFTYAPVTNVIYETSLSYIAGAMGTEYGDKENVGIKMGASIFY